MQLEIEKLIYGGDGLARIPSSQPGSGKSVFVPFVLEGERVEALRVEEKAGFIRARLESVLQASGHRVEPNCPYFQRCGGCHYQQAAYDRQVAIKAEVLRETLARTAKLELTCELNIHQSSAWQYRNRTRLQVRTTPRWAVGYFRFRSHEVMPIEHCPISSPLINHAIQALVTAEADRMRDEIREVELFVNHQDEAMLAIALCAAGTRRARARELAERLEELLPAVSGVSVFAQGRTPADDLTQLASLGSGHLFYQTKEHGYRVSAGSFFQVNRFLIDELVAIATGGLSGSVALDVYAGVGLFSAILARHFNQVIAVESSPSASRDLKQNVSGIEVVHSPAERYLARFSSSRPDVAVLDPPRAGLGKKVIQDLIRIGPARIVYVSCDPATLARDLGVFRDSGYRIESAHLIDLFPQTYHIESVIRMSR
jgi:23S rRNA (uracil1939-C5)-methyltransferase